MLLSFTLKVQKFPALLLLCYMLVVKYVHMHVWTHKLTDSHACVCAPVHQSQGNTTGGPIEAPLCYSASGWWASSLQCGASNVFLWNDPFCPFNPFMIISGITFFIVRGLMAIYERFQKSEEIATTLLEEWSGDIINQNKMEALALEEPTDTNQIGSYIKPGQLWVFSLVMFLEHF